MLAVLLSLTASAFGGFSVNGIWYEHLDSYSRHVVVRGMADGEICPSQLIIPSKVTDGNGDTYKVVAIGGHAFAGCNNLVSLYFNDNVETISNDAFIGCTNLKYIHFPSTLNTILASVFSMTAGAFEGCTALESVYLPESMNHQNTPTANNNICRWAFKNCTSLKTVYIAATVPGIEEEAFFNCTSIRYLVSNITAPTALNSNTFQGIPSTATLIVPNGTRSAYLSASGWNRFSNIVERSNSTKFSQ